MITLYGMEVRHMLIGELVDRLREESDRIEAQYPETHQSLGEAVEKSGCGHTSVQTWQDILQSMRNRQHKIKVLIEQVLVEAERLVKEDSVTVSG